MKSEFSEFSYGYAIVDELLNWRGIGLRTFPFFPSLREEAKLGYDVRLDRPGAPIFLQFKLSDGMERNTAAEIQKHALPLTLPIYRMHLIRADRSKQHSLLVSLNRRQRYVYYVAPRFHRGNEFGRHYLSHDVVDNSIFISPRDIGKIHDKRNHMVSFGKTGRTAWFQSKPKAIENTSNAEKIGSSIVRFLDNDMERERSLSSRTKRLLASVLGALEENKIQQPEFDEPPPEDGKLEYWRLRRVAFLARRYLNCQFSIIQAEKHLG